jgi:DNA primase
LIPEEVIAEIRERTDIVQIVGQHVQLKRSGINHKGLCPFHDEKTPSFNVNSQRQFYHCFGCHESGDVFSFLMKIEGRSFTEVVEDLAARAGVEVPRQNVSREQARAATRRRSERQRGFDLNHKVADLYRELLHGPEGLKARRYLEERGIGEAVSAAFLLGYAPASGNAVVRMAEADRSLDFAERIGLVAQRSGRQGYHDRFWDRLIFPVVGAGGEVLGFGGRMLGEREGPKYVNTPETFMYRKGEALYGLEAAAKAMRQQRFAVVVEGNFDVLQLHQHGYQNTVAPMGTALTERQVLLLRRFAPEVVAIFDGDDAGQAAALKSVPILVEGGVVAKVATLPRGQDPDSYLREHGTDAMDQLLTKAQPAIDFMIDVLDRQAEDSIPGRARMLEQVAPVVAKLPSRAEQDLYIGRLALDLKTDQRVVRRAVAGGRPSEIREQLQRRGASQTQSPKTPISEGELTSIAILADHPHLVPRAEEAGLSSLLTNDGLRATYRAAVEMQQVSGQIDPVKLIEAAPPELRDQVAQVVMSGAFSSVGDPTRALDDCLCEMTRRRLKQQRQEIKRQMAEARSDGDTESERALARRMIEVEREIHETR